jgi:hypothetical protein
LRARERERERKIKDEKQITKEEENLIRVVVRFFGFFPCRSTGFSLSLSPLFDNRFSFVCRLILWFLE